MIRLAFALCALLAIGDALAQDMREVNDCMQRAIGWTCPNTGRMPELPRTMTWDTAKIYCQCRVLSKWDTSQDNACLALSRVCEFGDI